VIARNSKASIIGSLCGIILVIGANLYDSSNMGETICFDCYRSFGVPFKMYGSGGIGHITEIFWLGLLTNFLIGIIFSIGLGCVFQKVSRIIKPKSASD
jgi:hypothetical protein